MEALNALGLNPLSVLAKTREEPKKKLSLSTIFPFKNHASTSLVLLSSVLNVELSKALTYEEALQQSVSGNSSDIDFNGVVESLISFATENPLIIGGGAAILTVPLVVSQLLSKPKPWGLESAKVAYTKLGDDGNAQLLDIRAASEIKQMGSPDIRGLKKKPVVVVYKGEDKPGFLNTLALKFKEPENTTLFILDNPRPSSLGKKGPHSVKAPSPIDEQPAPERKHDTGTRFDGNSELVAELATANGFKAAYAIKDGAEGSRGWMNSGLPWIQPKKTFSLDLSNFTDAFGEASGGVPLTLGVAVAAVGAGLLAFTEVETLLQLLGSAALIQFVSKKVLFAKDRKQTIQQLEDVLNTKVAPKELVGDIQQIGRALLPELVTSSKSLPAPPAAEPIPTPLAAQISEPIPEPTPTPLAVQISEPIPEPKIEAAQELAAPPQEVNSVPKAQVEESVPVISRPLSPYPNYPDFKPPSSPIPTQP